MNKWYKENQGAIHILALLASAFAYCYTTFATVDYVDKKHQDVVSVLDRMDAKLEDTRNKVYELNGEKASILKK